MSGANRALEVIAKDRTRSIPFVEAVVPSIVFQKQFLASSWEFRHSVRMMVASFAPRPCSDVAIRATAEVSAWRHRRHEHPRIRAAVPAPQDAAPPPGRHAAKAVDRRASFEARSPARNRNRFRAQHLEKAQIGSRRLVTPFRAGWGLASLPLAPKPASDGWTPSRKRRGGPGDVGLRLLDRPRTFDRRVSR